MERGGHVVAYGGRGERGLDEDDGEYRVLDADHLAQHEPCVGLGQPDQTLQQTHCRPRGFRKVGVSLPLVVLHQNDLGVPTHNRLHRRFNIRYIKENTSKYNRIRIPNTHLQM